MNTPTTSSSTSCASLEEACALLVVDYGPRSVAAWARRKRERLARGERLEHVLGFPESSEPSEAAGASPGPSSPFSRTDAPPTFADLVPLDDDEVPTARETPMVKRGARQEQVYEWLRANGASRQGVIATALETTSGNVSSALAQLALKGRVMRDAGTWRVVDELEHAIATGERMAAPRAPSPPRGRPSRSVPSPRPAARKSPASVAMAEEALVRDLRAHREQIVAKLAKIDAAIEALS